ncbi:Pentatricopeptide repeat-containing protein [Platanthera zijinensis]|uniref:Pentatricopeptide repeat-containing protein n=1 Tax=Platanthera zijinensis TaxID=2320716 RepID=A0AAP0B4G4_9ASPA
MVSPLLNQPSPLPTNSIFSKSTSHSDKPNSSKSLIIWTKPELQKAIKSLEDESIRTIKSNSHQALYSSLISSCIRHKALDEGDRLRAHMARARFQPTVFLNNQFINLCSRCGASDKARRVFDEMPERNIVSWNAMIAGYCGNALFVDALVLLKMMMEDGVVPDCLTYLSALRASASSGDCRLGEQVHALVIKNGFFLSFMEIGNALINFYSKIGALQDAELIFDSMATRDAVTWNSIITANSQNGNCEYSTP